MRGAALLLALVVASGVFLVFPAIDLAVSAAFYDGTGFAVQQIPMVEAVRLTLYAAEDLAAALTLTMALVTAWRGHAVRRLTRNDWIFAFGVFALGPGLLVNGILKPMWGRARPYLVTEFGGEMQFTPAWVFSDQCQADCSFVSGEMAGAVALAVLLAMVARTYAAVWLLVAAVPLFTAWQRVAAGRHFLSDVVLSALMVALIGVVLARQFAPARPLASAVDIPRDSP